MNIKNEIKKLENIKVHMPDLIIRKLNVGVFKYVYIVTCQTLSSEDKVNDFVLKYFSNKSIFKGITNVKKDITNFIPSVNIKEINTSEDIMFYILNGFTVILSEHVCAAFETKAQIDRAITESSSEPAVKGPKDSFNENFQMNVGLIRRRIKSENLYLKEMYIGDITSTKVGILYMNDIAQADMVHEVTEKIEKIKTDQILDSYYIKELMKKENKTLFPIVSSKEKPDEIALALLKGKICVVVENSPNVLIIPTLFVEFIHNGEDYYQKPFYVTFVRIIRILAFFICILLPGFYIALTTVDQQILPTSLLINFATQRDGVPFPAVLEAFILMITFEILYEGDARTPTSKGTSLSIVGALVLGDAAVNAGLVSPIMVIVIAISAISSLLFMYVDMQASIRFWRYLIMGLSAVFGLIGFIVGSSLILIDLCNIKSFGKPYLMPMVPFYKKEAFSDAIFKKSVGKIKMKKTYFTREGEDGK